jgi:ABC-type dipeptide/oligopeptide/nickel transport system permease component
MTVYIVRRLLSAVVIVFISASLVFIAMRILPGDPALVVLGNEASAEAIAALRVKLGINMPLWEQYISFIWGSLRGDFGRSLLTRMPNSDAIARLLPFSIELAMASALIGILIGIPLGILTALKKDTIIDSSGRFFSILGFSMPAFYLGILMLLLFSLRLGWFPIIHSPKPGDLWDRLYKLALPALSLGIIQAAFVTRLTRGSMLEVLGEDYIRTARAKGLRDVVVNYKHSLRNALIPVVTAIGLYTSSLLGGAILTETVFNRPGLGKLLVGAMKQRDYTLVQSVILVFAVMVVLVNLMVDVSYAFIDPRIRYD